MADFFTALRRVAEGENLGLSPEQLRRLSLHWQLVKEANEKFNLTAIIEDEKAAILHYLDSLLLLPELDVRPAGGRLADLGSGAGFPGLVLALARPQLPVTLVEATEKKADFLRDCGRRLGLPQLRVANLRAEQAGREEGMRGAFDLVTARALAPLPVLVEYALPLLNHGGLLLAMKGPDWRAETEHVNYALSQLGGALLSTSEYHLPTGEARSLIIVEKVAPTPEKYPRRVGMPSKKPL